MVNVFIIHGSYGHPEENWFPWLKKELENSGCKVFVPKFPTPENQSLKSWLDVFKKYENYLNEDSIVVGHSLGPAFLLSILEKRKVKAAFFVAGFLSSAGNPKFDEVNKTFINKNFDWQKIKQNCKTFYVYHSDTDPYLPLAKGDDLAEKLGVKLKVIKNAGHFNKSAGYTKFPLLLDDIKNIL